MSPPPRARTALTIAALSMACLLGGWKAPDRAARKKNPVPVSEESIQRGKQIYVRECQDCHGPGGKGDGPAAKDMPESPDLGVSRVQKQTDGELFYKISAGRKPMPGAEKTLTDEQRWHVVNYTRSLGRK